MQEDREMTPADYQAVTKDCIKKTVNFGGDVPIHRKLEWFQIDTDGEIGTLKDLLTGKNNPDIGVTHFFYRLDRTYLNIDSSTTVLELADLVKGFSIPDMNNRRSLLLISGSAKKVTGNAYQPDPNHRLTAIDITGENIDEFKMTVVQNPVWGVNRFRRRIAAEALGNVDQDTRIGTVMDILRHDSEPNFDNGGANA
jgi:hypothetical protein